MPLELQKIKQDLDIKLSKEPISARVLLDRLRLLDDASRKSGQYQDPRYLPFYYYLSKSIFPKNAFVVGLDLGLHICCFLKGSDTLEEVTAFQRKNDYFYSPRLAISNIKDVKGKKFRFRFYQGNISDQKIENFDYAMIIEKTNADVLAETLELCWSSLNSNGFISLEHIEFNKSTKGVLSSFCKGKNANFIEFETRYGTALIQK